MHLMQAIYFLFYKEVTIMLYNSTRNSTLEVESAQAIVKGISDDGGLFVPKNFPN